jgi:hypothetical protein
MHTILGQIDGSGNEQDRVFVTRPCDERWSRFLRQVVKVDAMTKRMIHHEDAQTVFG